MLSAVTDLISSNFAISIGIVLIMVPLVVFFLLRGSGGQEDIFSANLPYPKEYRHVSKAVKDKASLAY